ncbi:hypothetical protein [Metalysinibacillus jejuensis]|uniref:hypothetical protein n=1 Tax=Metalysinibacillus jejuensis TaxID=914327 RepID=UPI000D3AB35E|nr:hypothetical protein [Metalysinibacillus jejuensis]
MNLPVYFVESGEICSTIEVPRGTELRPGIVFREGISHTEYLIVMVEPNLINNEPAQVVHITKNNNN